MPIKNQASEICLPGNKEKEALAVVTRNALIDGFWKEADLSARIADGAARGEIVPRNFAEFLENELNKLAKLYSSLNKDIKAETIQEITKTLNLSWSKT